MKIGLVLAGGGTKGAYQVGVWKALKESSGFDGKLEDMPIELMKELYTKLTVE